MRGSHAVYPGASVLNIRVPIVEILKETIAKMIRYANLVEVRPVLALDHLLVDFILGPKNASQRHERSHWVIGDREPGERGLALSPSKRYCLQRAKHYQPIN